MTPPSDIQTTPVIPQSIVLGELALAAGMAGYGVAVSWRDYPASLLCGIWRYFAACVGENRVRQISSQADARKLSEQLDEVGLVLLHAPRLQNPIAWAIQMAVPGEALTRPVVFSRFTPVDPDEDPSATLVVRGNASECTLIKQWLAGDARRLAWPSIELADTIGMDPALVPVLSSDFSANERGQRRFRDGQILQGLLAGACLLRVARQENSSGGLPAVTLQDYDLVRRILQSRLVGSADDSFDPLAIAMVNRANAYIAAQYAPSGGEGNPFRTDGRRTYAQRVVDRPPRELITRREVTDLGNTRSRLVCRLVRHLQQHPNGYEQFAKMGLLRRPPSRGSWARDPAGELALLLRPWSLKQVRDHFDALRRGGLITAEREPANGPWRYLLPEELATAANPFRALPSVQELATNAPG